MVRAEKASHPGEPGILVAGIEGGRTGRFRIGAHGAELIDTERLPSPSEALLDKEHRTAVFLTVLGTTQILLEQMRRDNYLRLIIFVRVNQLAALITLIIVLAVLLIRYRPGKTAVILSLAVLVLAGLADMASEFVFDKFEYAPYLYLSMPLAAAAFAALMLTQKKKHGILPAVLVCAATAALLIAYASKDWNEIEITPELDMIRFAILYATMAVDLICIGLTIRLNRKQPFLRD